MPRRPKAVRYRPPWHRVIGAIELALGVLLIVIYYGTGFGYHPLPGSAFWYYTVGGSLAYYSTFWFGLWDRPR